MKKILVNLILLFVALFLLLTVGIFGLIYTMGITIISFDLNNFLKYWGSLLYQINVGIDQIGNVLLGEFLNKNVLINDTEYKFGNVDETISYVLAKNINNLTLLGTLLVNILEFLDPGHMEKSLK